MPMQLIGQSAPIRDLRRAIERSRESKSCVLIHGESGTGKEVVARSLHASTGEFVVFSCPLISFPLTEFQGDLFGVAAGYIDGPSEGYLARARGGTLFLDEIEMLPIEYQFALLRLLQERSFQPRGGASRVALDARIVSATTWDLSRAVESGEFQKDLYYHLSAITLRTPTLRECKEDIPEMIKAFLPEIASVHGYARDHFTVTSDLLAALSEYSWPGNVRELKCSLESMALFSGAPILDIHNLPKELMSGRERSTPTGRRVFLCHSSTDKQRVRDLYQRLIAKGVKPWLDEEDLLPGQDWRHEITKAVRSCSVVVVCLSRSAVSKDGFIQKEIALALDIAEEKPEGSIFIIPLKLEHCEVPSRLRRWQWVDISNTDGFERFMRAIAVGSGDTSQ